VIPYIKVLFSTSSWIYSSFFGISSFLFSDISILSSKVSFKDAGTSISSYSIDLVFGKNIFLTYDLIT